MFSIIVPTHNRQKTLERALRSLCEQKCQNFEVIVVDDASSPAAEVAVQTYPFDLKLVRMEKNVGASAARNEGVYQASRPWIVFLDDDDVFTEDRLSVLEEVIRTHPEVDAVYHRAEIYLINENLRYETRLEESQQPQIDIWLSNIFGGNGAVVLKRDVFLAMNGFDITLPAMEDYELWMRCCAAGYKFYFLPRVLYRAEVITKTSSVGKHIRNNREALDRIYAKHEKIYTALPLSLRRLYWLKRFSFLGQLYALQYRRFGSWYFLVAAFLGMGVSGFAASVINFISPYWLLRLRASR